MLRLRLFVLGGRAGMVVGAKIEEDGAEERERERVAQGPELDLCAKL